MGRINMLKSSSYRNKSSPYRETSVVVKDSGYEIDFYKWIKTQAALLKKGEFSKLDIENIIEELEGLGRSDKRSLKSQITRLIMHLLKHEYQPSYRSRSWDESITNAQIEIRLIIEDSPSLKRHVPKIIKDSYNNAKKYAHIETGLDIKTFPENCPWTLKEILGE